MNNDKKMRIKKISASEQVSNKVWENIQNRMWNPGERLPSENELADLFGVNRLTVRNALQRLITLGIIETRVGEGSFVLNNNPAVYFQSVSKYYMKPGLINDVWEFRTTIELECARLAIERATEEEIEALRLLAIHHNDLCTAMGTEYTSKDLETVADADYRFHSHICRISHNSLFDYAFSVAKEPLYQYLKMILTKRWEQKKKLSSDKLDDNSHIQIYHAIANRDYEACKQIYLEMVDYTADK